MPLTQELKSNLTRKVGPLPVWGWGVAVVGAFVVVRLFHRGSGSSSSSSGGIYDLGPGGSGGVLPDGGSGAGGGGGGGGGSIPVSDGTSSGSGDTSGIPTQPASNPGGLPIILPSGAPLSPSTTGGTPVATPGSIQFPIPGGGSISDLYNPGAIAAAGSSVAPPNLASPSQDTVGLLNQYIYAYNHQGSLPSDAWQRFRDLNQVKSQIVQLTAQVLASGGQYYGGYSLSPTDINLARSLNQGNAFNLTPQFNTALNTGQATLAQSIGVENLPLPSASVPVADTTHASTVDPHGGITLADISSLQTYISRLSAVKSPTTAQKTELSTYQARLADYQRRYNGG